MATLGKTGLQVTGITLGGAHLRARGEAMAQLEGTLRAMRTDYFDLWQCNEVVTQAEVDKILSPSDCWNVRS
jgi:hypothetical protein